MRRFLIFFSIFVALGLGSIAVFGYLVLVKPVRDVVSEYSRDQISPRKSEGYVIEDGVVAYRPYSSGDIAVAAIFSLGQALQSEWLVGREMPEADRQSFQVLSPAHARDKRNVYFAGHALEDADPASFLPVSGLYAHDHRNLWKGSKLLGSFERIEAGTVAPHSARLVSVGAQTFFATEGLEPVAENPRGQVREHCRRWYQMNDALWFGADKISPTGPEIQIIDCDGSVRSNASGEIVEANSGLTYIQGNQIITARIDGSVQNVYTTEGSIKAAALIEPRYDLRLLIIAQEDGQAAALNFDSIHQIQDLGRQSGDLSKINAKERSYITIGPHLFSVNEQEPVEEARFLTSEGAWRQDGEHVLSERSVFWNGFRIDGADPKTFRALDGRYGIDRGLCFYNGRFATELPIKHASESALKEACIDIVLAHRVIYEGLLMDYRPDYVFSSGTYQLGEVTFSNLSDAPLRIDVDVFDSIEFTLYNEAFSGGYIVKNKPVFDRDGDHYIVPPDTKLVWPIRAVGPNPDGHFSAYFSFSHSARYRERLNRDEFRLFDGIPLNQYVGETSRLQQQDETR